MEKEEKGRKYELSLRSEGYFYYFNTNLVVIGNV